MGRAIVGRAIVAGAAEGQALVSREPLSFWGGFDYRTGEIIDRRHELSGIVATGRVLAVPFTRGSSTTTAVLLEAIRLHTAPAAIVTPAFDAFFALAAIVADEMYVRSIPIVVVTPDDFAALETGQLVRIDEQGTVQIT